MNEKLLVLIRHGDAEQFSYKLPGNDLLRELTSFGVSKIKKLSDYLTENKVNVDKIISSISIRTSQTAQIISKSITYDANDIEYNDKIYNGKIEDYMHIIESIGNHISKLMIVGHSPTITEFGEYLVGKPIGHLQEGGIILIKLLKWSNIHNREGKLIYAKNFLQGTLKLA